MAKKKKGQQVKVKVKGSKPHRRKGTWIRAHWRNRTKKAFRNQPHKRNPRRTKAEIKKKGTRKQERKKGKPKEINKKKIKSPTKTKQTKLAQPRKKPAQRSVKKA